MVFGHASFAGVNVLGREGAGAGAAEGASRGAGAAAGDEWSGARSAQARRRGGRSADPDELQREEALRQLEDVQEMIRKAMRQYE